MSHMNFEVANDGVVTMKHAHCTEEYDYYSKVYLGYVAGHPFVSFDFWFDNIYMEGALNA